MQESYSKKTITHFFLNSKVQLPVRCCMTHYTCFCGMLCEKGHKVPLLFSLCFLLLNFQIIIVIIVVVFGFFFLTQKITVPNIADDVEYTACGKSKDVSFIVLFSICNCSINVSCSLCGIFIVWAMKIDEMGSLLSQHFTTQYHPKNKLAWYPFSCYYCTGRWLRSWAFVTFIETLVFW